MTDLEFKFDTNDGYISNEVFENSVIEDIQLLKSDFKEVEFKNCRFINLSFSGSSFRDCVFKSCDLSNCDFSETYLKNTTFLSCRCDGADISRSRIKYSEFEIVLFHTQIFKFVIENSCFKLVLFKEAFLSEIKLKKTKFNNCNFAGADMFNTSLKDIDISNCEIEGIRFSENIWEFRGAIIDPMQSIEIIKALGVKFI